MNASEKPLVYVILGATGSGRRSVLADLIDGGLAQEDRSVVVLSENEAEPELEKRLPRVAHWSWLESQVVVPEGVLGDATHVFFVTAGRENPVDQLEAFKVWFDQSGTQIGRVLCLVNCQLAEQHAELIAWYEACIHFSDVVLLARREGVANKWLSDFQNRFKDQYFPCIFEFVKEGRVKNPPLILEPEARRMSHLFDETEWVALDDSGEEEEQEQEEDEEVELTPKADPYFERNAAGRRLKEIPDIERFLQPRTQSA